MVIGKRDENTSESGDRLKRKREKEMRDRKEATL